MIAICLRAREVRAGLTLIELLVVIAILGVLATGIVPSVQALMASARAQDIEARLHASWQLALAIAQAKGKPVVWQAHAAPTKLELSIRDAQGDPIWSMTLPASKASFFVGNGTQGQSDAALVVYPHGLTQSVAVEWQTVGTGHHANVQDTPKLGLQE